MRLDAANFVNKRAGRADEAASEVVVDERFNFRREQRMAEFRMAGEMKMDFAVVIARHGWFRSGG